MELKMFLLIIKKYKILKYELIYCVNIGLKFYFYFLGVRYVDENLIV